MFRQVSTVALVVLMAFGSIAVATAAEPKGAGGTAKSPPTQPPTTRADHQLDRHEADARPFGRVHDGQQGVGGGYGCFLQQDLRRGFSESRFFQGRASAAPGADHQAVLPGHLPCHAGPVSAVRRRHRVQDGRGEGEKPGPYGWNPDTKEFGFNEKYSWRNAGFVQTDEHPVVNVSWNDAVAFCKWLSRRRARPTACPQRRSGNTPAVPGRQPATTAATSRRRWLSRQPGGRDDQGEIPGWEIHDQSQRGRRVHGSGGKFKPNAFGLYDMHGNAWQWCADWYGAEYYAKSPVDDPTGPDSGDDRVLRGGSWFYGPIVARSADTHR